VKSKSKSVNLGVNLKSGDIILISLMYKKTFIVKKPRKQLLIDDFAVFSEIHDERLPILPFFRGKSHRLYRLKKSVNGA